MKSDVRLRAIENEVSGNVLADIGCDHGKISAMALQEGRVKKVIACDISEPSLQKAVKLAEKLDLKNIEFRHGDGLKVINDNEVDVVVIAGMGGYEISKILDNIPKGINKFILVAHADVLVLRNKICSIGLHINKDYIVKCDAHYYSIIVCEYGIDKLSNKDLLLGRDSKTNSDYVKYLNYMKDRYEKILSRTLPQESRDEFINYLRIVEDEINEGK